MDFNDVLIYRAIKYSLPVWDRVQFGNSTFNGWGPIGREKEREMGTTMKRMLEDTTCASCDQSMFPVAAKNIEIDWKRVRKSSKLIKVAVKFYYSDGFYRSPSLRQNLVSLGNFWLKNRFFQNVSPAGSRQGGPEGRVFTFLTFFRHFFVIS